jgi:hypothetical protein
MAWEVGGKVEKAANKSDACDAAANWDMGRVGVGDMGTDEEGAGGGGGGGANGEGR